MDERIIPVIYGLCLLLWVASSQIADPRTRRLARQGSWAVLAVGLVLSLIQLGMWIIG